MTDLHGTEELMAYWLAAHQHYAVTQMEVLHRLAHGYMRKKHNRKANTSMEQLNSWYHWYRKCAEKPFRAIWLGSEPPSFIPKEMIWTGYTKDNWLYIPKTATEAERHPSAEILRYAFFHIPPGTGHRGWSSLQNVRGMFGLWVTKEDLLKTLGPNWDITYHNMLPFHVDLNA